MIKANGILIKPTIFPDGTSQVWKLPKKLLESKFLELEWKFQAERELFDLFSLRELLPSTKFFLFMDFLPYGRQDKPVSNDSTFNLRTFAKLINQLGCERVTAYDPHNLPECRRLILNFYDTSAYRFHKRAVEQVKPDFILFPDAGANFRYASWFHSSDYLSITLQKRRNTKTGKISSYRPSDWPKAVTQGRALIVDDICDGGATFIELAKFIKRVAPKVKLYLAVSHGIFSKGRKVLTDEGIKIIDRKEFT